MSAREGYWSTLLAAAFTQSKNPMILLDSHRRILDINGASLALLGYSRSATVGRPIYELNADHRISDAEWNARMSSGHFTGEGVLRTADGATMPVQWAATVEIVTGHRRILFVALSTSRWGRRFRSTAAAAQTPQSLSERELAVVRLVALGKTGPEIADELHIAHDTVRTHVRNAMGKVAARSRAQLVAKALGDGHAL